MAPRPGAARPRDIDFSAVGKAGRRTGITLPKQRLDEHGLEEVSNLFSSPRKPSPLKNVITAEGLMEKSGLTPTRALSTRKSLRASIPRSASPRKTGISGTARRSNAVDLRALSRDPGVLDSDDQDIENGEPSSPTRANHSARRYSGNAETYPLRDITSKNTPNSRDKSTWDKLSKDQAAIVASIEDEYRPRGASNEIEQDLEYQPGNDDDGPIIGDDDNGVLDHRDFAPSAEPPPPFDDEEADQTFEPEPAFPQRAKANSRRKRKSDLEIPTSSPATKRVRRESPKAGRSIRTQSAIPEEVDSQDTAAESSKAPAQRKPKQRGGPPKSKSTKSKTTSRYPKQLEEVVDRIRSRPNPPKSLYVLRRETPADDGVTLTRSGRVSFKPLAYWRNEQCIFGGSPNGVGLKDGARFPLNSIKEIIRTEEVEQPIPRKKKGKKGKGRAVRSKSRTAEVDLSDSESDEERFDPDAEPWEAEPGKFSGPVSVWDPVEQAPIDDEEEIEIAYAPAAIQTTLVNVKGGQDPQGPSFKYAKLLGNQFMGAGLVDLEPGGIKRPKNSRKMHMAFFVVKGRVTVHVGPAGVDESGNRSRFSIGKGGFWQVPRGNQYSIENELEKPARIFFSQGCEVTLEDDG